MVKERNQWNRVKGWREEWEEMNEERQGKKKREYLGWVISSDRLSIIMEGGLQLILWTNYEPTSIKFFISPLRIAVIQHFVAAVFRSQQDLVMTSWYIIVSHLQWLKTVALPNSVLSVYLSVFVSNMFFFIKMLLLF